MLGTTISWKSVLTKDYIKPFLEFCNNNPDEKIYLEQLGEVPEHLKFE